MRLNIQERGLHGFMSSAERGSTYTRGHKRQKDGGTIVVGCGCTRDRG